MKKFLLFYVKKFGQPTILKGLLFCTVITLILMVFPFGIRKELTLLERSVNTELWYTNNPNISNFLQFSDRNNCKHCRNVSNICKNLDGGEVVYFVSSYIRNTKRRHAIRGTWGATELNLKPIFIMGISLIESEMLAVLNEAHEFNDMIIENFIDAFENSTLKTANALKHFNKFCPNTKYLMKTEDDMFINTALVENIVRRHTSVGRNKGDFPIIGYTLKEAHVIRNPRAVWYVGHSMFSEQKYPAYASRTGYLLPGDSVKEILTKSVNIPMIPIEDAFFTGIVASQVGLRHEMNTKFDWRPLTVNNHCIIRTRAIIYEPDPLEMYKLWKSLKDNHTTKCFNWYNSLIVKMFA